MKIKPYIRELTPPVIWKTAKRIKRSIRTSQGRTSRWTYGVEQPVEFYDEKYESTRDLHLHYTKSYYYPLWTVIADRVRCYGATSVLDIGCGTGQLGCLFRDRGVPRYTGLDFSPARIARARDNCPEFDFFIEDVHQSNLLESRDYDIVVTTEFLEHIDDDLGVLHRLPGGIRVLATVPNFPAWGHVRHFESADAVHRRYQSVLDDLHVHTLLMNPIGRVIYIVDGKIAGQASGSNKA